MIGGAQNGADISKYLQNFNTADWANQANSYLTNALNQGLQYSQNYSKAAAQQIQKYDRAANQSIQRGYQMAQAIDTPQRMATYNALDAYTSSLGLPSPTQGSFNVANQLTKNVANHQVRRPINPPKKPALLGAP